MNNCQSGIQLFTPLALLSQSLLFFPYPCSSVCICGSKLLSDRSELITPLPLDGKPRQEALPRGPGFGWLDECECFAPRHFQQIEIADRIGDIEAEFAVLARAEKFPWAAQFQIGFCDLETVGGAHHGFEAHLRVVPRILRSNQDAGALFSAAPNTTTQLMQLREAKTV